MLNSHFIYRFSSETIDNFIKVYKITKILYCIPVMDQYCVSFFYLDNGKCIVKRLSDNWISKNPIIHNYLKIRGKNLSLNETIYCMKHNIIEKPVCEYCGKPVKFMNISYGYSHHCSSLCARMDPAVKEKTKNTCLEHFGVECSLQSKSVIEKRENTNLQKYGVKNVFSNNEIKNKIKSTLIEKYGVDHPMKSEEIIARMEKNNIIKYGVKNPMQLKENQEKLQATSSIKYGTNRPSQSQRVREKIAAALNSEQVRDKVVETKKKNSSFKYSSREDIAYKLILKVYSNVIRQYRSDKYPFLCDFYIPSENLYIEFNGTWTHGGMPYIDNDECNIKLSKWIEKSKNSNYYKNAINTWTIRDVNKREFARKNNLNYIEFWTLKDIENWLQNKKED